MIILALFWHIMGLRANVQFGITTAIPVGYSYQKSSAFTRRILTDPYPFLYGRPELNKAQLMPLMRLRSDNPDDLKTHPDHVKIYLFFNLDLFSSKGIHFAPKPFFLL
jgi:hypothetical protein